MQHFRTNNNPNWPLFLSKIWVGLHREGMGVAYMAHPRHNPLQVYNIAVHVSHQHPVVPRVKQSPELSIYLAVDGYKKGMNPKNESIWCLDEVYHTHMIKHSSFYLYFTSFICHLLIFEWSFKFPIFIESNPHLLQPFEVRWSRPVFSNLYDNQISIVLATTLHLNLVFILRIISTYISNLFI